MIEQRYGKETRIESSTFVSPTMPTKPHTPAPDKMNHFVVMDSFGGDWTPFAVLSDATEAIRLQQMLSADADARCATGPFFRSPEAAKNGELSKPPEGIDEIIVVFNSYDVVALSDNDRTAREIQAELGESFRTAYAVYETAEDVVTEKPQAVGKFISTNATASDLLDEIE